MLLEVLKQPQTFVFIHIDYVLLLLLLLLRYSLRVFISALVDVFSLEPECQQVSPSLQDSSEYSSRFRLDGLDSFNPFFKSFGIVPSSPIRIGIIFTLMFLRFF